MPDQDDEDDYNKLPAKAASEEPPETGWLQQLQKVLPEEDEQPEGEPVAEVEDDDDEPFEDLANAPADKKSGCGCFLAGGLLLLVGFFVMGGWGFLKERVQQWINSPPTPNANAAKTFPQAPVPVARQVVDGQIPAPLPSGKSLRHDIATLAEKADGLTSRLQSELQGISKRPASEILPAVQSYAKQELAAKNPQPLLDQAAALQSQYQLLAAAADAQASGVSAPARALAKQLLETVGRDLVALQNTLALKQQKFQTLQQKLASLPAFYEQVKAINGAEIAAQQLQGEIRSLLLPL
jgi:hypothetical protein